MPDVNQVTIEYDNRQIGQLDSLGDATLITRDKKCESDIKIKLRKYPTDTGFKLHVDVADPVLGQPEGITFMLLFPNIGLNPNTDTYMMTAVPYTGSAHYDLILSRTWVDGITESLGGCAIIVIDRGIHVQVTSADATVATVQVGSANWFIIEGTSESTVTISTTSV